MLRATRYAHATRAYAMLEVIQHVLLIEICLRACAPSKRALLFSFIIFFVAFAMMPPHATPSLRFTLPACVFALPRGYQHYFTPLSFTRLRHVTGVVAALCYARR